jgi:hypothetical protein
MDAHRLRSVIDLIIAEHRRLEVYQQLTWIQQKLDDCTANPCSESDEQFRSALTGLLTELRGTAINDLVESDRRILSRIEGDRVAGTGRGSSTWIRFVATPIPGSWASCCLRN